jgi:hypothetical protein
VEGFLQAFNRGDWKAVDRFFAPDVGGPPPDFQFFAWRRDSVRARDEVTSFLASMREGGERFRLLGVRASTEARVPSSAGIVYKLEGAGGPVLGKGLIDCGRQQIWQWAMAPAGGQLPCPQPPGWSASGPIVACTSGPNARSLSPGFAVGPTSLALPRRCKPDAVRRRVTSALTRFNLGHSAEFAKHLVPKGQFHPYTTSIRGMGFVGRSRIARFVRARYDAGDGWTALRLLPPQGTIGPPARTAYGLQLGISYQGATFADQVGAKLVVSCSTGLLEQWVGPAGKVPPNR